MSRPAVRVLCSAGMLALLAVQASLFAAEPAARSKPAATSKSSAWGVRQVLLADARLPHVLLVGDSILSGYHAKAAELLRGGVNLDVWITPKHIGSNDRCHWTRPAYELLAECAVSHIAKALELSLPVIHPAPAGKQGQEAVGTEAEG